MRISISQHQRKTYRSVWTTVRRSLSHLQYNQGSFGHLARGSVLSTRGGTVVHAAVCIAPIAEETDDVFVPLNVEYRARHYAYGAIPGNIQRRERHGTDDEVLVARFVDRSIRPLFDKGLWPNIHITVTNHATDGIHDPTVLAVNAASLALMKAGYTTTASSPWHGPVACVRVGLLNGKLVLNPTIEEMAASELDLVYAGTWARPIM